MLALELAPDRPKRVAHHLSRPGQGQGGLLRERSELELVLVFDVECKITTMAAVNLRPHALDVGSSAASPNSDSTLVMAGCALTTLALEQSRVISEGSIGARVSSW